MPITPPQLPRDLLPATADDLLSGAEEFDGRSFRGIGLPPYEMEHLFVQGCTFTGCRLSGSVLRNCRFSDVVFRNCDLSNADWQGCSFHRTEFTECKLVGTGLAETLLMHVVLEGCKADLANLTRSKWQCVRFEGCALHAAVLSECRVDRVEFSRCDLTEAEFYGTRLRGLSLADSDIRAIRVREADSYELKGLRVTPLQAVELARLLGIEIEE